MNKEKLNALALMAEGTEKLNDGMKALLEAEGADIEQAAGTAVKKASSKVVSMADKKASKAVPGKKAKAPVEDADNEDPTNEEISEMGYNDLKAFAKSIGVTATGTRDQLVKKVQNAVNGVEDEDEGDEVEEAPAKKAKATSKKAGLGKKKSAPAEEAEEEDFEEDPVYQSVVEATEEMTDDEIRETLSDIGYSTKGKRQALLSKVYDAVKAGDLDLGGEEEAEEEEEPAPKKGKKTSSAKKAPAKKAPVEEEEEDEGEEEEVEDTPKRKKALKAFTKENEEAFEEGELAEEDMKGFLESYVDAKELKKLKGKALLKKYIEVASNFIGDDGVTYEEGAYVVRGENYCCGLPLEEGEEEGELVCSICGESYPVEE